MKKTILIFFMFIIFSLLLSQNPQWTWAINSGMDNYNYGYGMRVDTNGNMLWVTSAGDSVLDMGFSKSVDSNGYSYVTGYFSDIVAFDSFTLTSVGGYDIFIAKLDAEGNWLWVKSAGSSNYDYSHSISVDSSGNSYITGFFSDTATFGSFTLTSVGGYDIFIAKLDLNGNWIWAKSSGGIGSDIGYGISVDANENSYVTGWFCDPANFGSFTLTSILGYDIFVAKLDAEGNWLWATSAGSGSGGEMGRSISVDENGNSYVIGNFKNEANFGTLSLNSNGEFDIFVAKLDADGNWLWAKRAGGSDFDIGEGICIDLNGNSYVTGSFKDSSTFGNTTFTSNGGSDIFIAKLDVNGNWQWAKQVGGNGNDTGFCINIDEYSNSYVTGWFNDIITIGETTLTSSGSADIFIAKLDSGIFVDFSANPTTGYYPSLEVNFTDESNGYISNWFWDFQNDGIYDSFEQNPNFTYNDAGVYDVKLKISNETQVDSLIKENYISVTTNPDPVIYVVPNSLNFGNVCVDSTVTLPIYVYNYGASDLIISNIVSSTDKFSISLPTRDISFTVSSLDSQLVYIHFMPTAIQSYSANLIFFSNDPVNSSLFTDVYGNGYEFYADFTAEPVFGDAPLQVTFEDSSVGDIQSWFWQFGDSDTSSVQNPVHTYQNEGVYTVTLTVQDNYHSGSFTKENYITVIGHPLISSPDSQGIDFGSVYLSDVSGDSLIVIENIGTDTIFVTGLSFINTTGRFNYSYVNLGNPILPAESDTIFVNFEPLSAQTYNDTLLISNNSENKPNLKIPLSGIGEYVPPTSPTNVQVHIVGDDAIISWTAVDTTIYGTPIEIDYYIVLFSEWTLPDSAFFYLDSTTDTTYTHNRVAMFRDQMFYKVESFVGTRQELEDYVERYLRKPEENYLIK